MKRLLDTNRLTFGRHRFGIGLLSLFLFLSGVHMQMAEDRLPAAQRDINAVLREHEKEWLAIKDVVGVYVGLEKDGRAPCLHVMLARDSSEARQAIPSQIQGYKVLIEVTGEIRPLPSESASPR